MVINLLQEPFRDYLDADNALFYLPRGAQPVATRLLFISLLKASEAKGGGRCAWHVTTDNFQPHLVANSWVIWSWC